MVTDGLKYAINDLWPVEFMTMNSTKIKLQITVSECFLFERIFFIRKSQYLIPQDARVNKPTIPPGFIGAKTKQIFPTECRQRSVTYNGKLQIQLEWYKDDKRQSLLDIDLAQIPIMLKVIFF